MNEAPTDSCDQSQTVLYTADYTYDRRGRLDTWSESVLGETRERRFRYDGAGRLTRVEDLATGDSIEEYGYDENGNRTRAVASGTSAELPLTLGCSSPSGDSAANDEDQLCRYGLFDYEYNDRGQLSARTRTSTGVRTEYTYDGVGRLHRVRTETGLDIRYVHDPLGRRIGKIVDGSLDRGWLYDSELVPIARLDEAGAVDATFVYGTSELVPDYMITSDGAAYRFIVDHLGSVRLVVDSATGEVVQRLDFDAYGQITSSLNPSFQPFGFAGGLHDADTGLIRFGARDYDPYGGRWTSRDPLRFDGGDTNLYAYGGGDPVNTTDPEGLVPAAAGAACFTPPGAPVCGAIGAGLLAAGAGVAIGAGIKLCWDKIMEARGRDKGRGKGERGRTRKPEGTPNPDKHTRWNDRTGNYEVKDPHTGKWKPKPPNWTPPGM